MKTIVLTVVLAGSLAHAQSTGVNSHYEDGRTRRFFGALLGGAATLAIPAVIGHLAAPPRCSGFRCPSELSLSLGVTTGVAFFGLGAGLPYTAWGGQAGSGFSFAGGVVGLGAGLAFLGIISAAMRAPWAAEAPVAGAGLLIAMSSLGSALALEWRDEALLGGAVSWSAGRAWVTGLAFWLSGLVFGSISGFVSQIAGSGTGQVALSVGLGVGSLALSSVVGYQTHRALGGKGSWHALPVGFLAGGMAGALLGTLLYLAPPSAFPFIVSGGEMSWPLLGVCVALFLAGPAVALEWSSAGAEASDLEWRKSIALMGPSDREETGVELFPAGLGVAGRF